MRVVIALNSLSLAQKLLSYLNQSADAVIVTRNINIDTSMKCNGREYPILAHKSFEKFLDESEWNYFLTCRNDDVGKIYSPKVNPAKIIYVDSIVNEDFLREIVLLSGIEQKISDFEMVAVGGFAALMGFSVEAFPVKTLNLCSKNQDMWLSYQWLKKILSMPQNKIRYALIGLSPYSFRYDLSTSPDKGEIFSYYQLFNENQDLPLDETLNSLFDKDFLYDKIQENIVEKNLLPAVNFSDLRGEKRANNRQLIQQDFRGVRAEARQWTAEKYSSNVQENRKIFVECLKLCKAHNVKPIVVNLPVHAFYKYLLPQNISAEITLAIHDAKKIVPFHFVDCFSWNLENGGEFCRIDALNTIGAQRITAKINPLIAKLQTNKIRVGFICQSERGHLEKLAPVYEEMRQKDDVEIVILVVPPYENYNLGQPFNPRDSRYIKAQQEAIENYGNNEGTMLVKVLSEDGFLDIESLNLDYVIYKRPYEVLLPPNVRCQVVNQFAKTCYVPYGLHIMEESVDFALGNVDFFNTLNFFFTDHKDFEVYGGNVYHNEFENSDQKFICLGSPEMDDVSKHFAPEVEFNLSKERKSVLWAPRWTYGPVMGGSHFMEYKDGFTSLRYKYPDLALNLRPHPLTFPTMVKEGRMTERDVEIYKDTLKRNNIYLDEHETLKSIFSKSDIMIADITSIIGLYFMTGNPIIYCQHDCKLFGNLKMQEPGIYIANSWAEVEKYLAMLLSGEDPLREKRRRIIKELQKIHSGAAEKIAQTIINDYYKTNWKND